MQIVSLPAANGRRWVVEGFRLLRHHPAALLAITFLYLLLLMATTIVPLVGPFAPMLLTPMLAVGMTHAVRSADFGQAPTPRMLLAGLTAAGARARRPLLLLGLVNVLSTLLALGLASLADGGTLLRIATGLSASDDPSLQEAALLLASAVFLLLYTPVQMALWYAPVFVAWHGLTPGKAMFFSLMAVMRNKGAFAQFGITWFLVALVASFAVQMLKLAFGSSPLLMSMVLSPLSLVVLSALYCSFWPSYRDAVQPDDDAPAPGAPHVR